MLPSWREAAALAAEVTLFLLALTQVVAGSPVAGSELQAAALQLMQNLHSRFHRAVGAMWAAEIPLLLQCLEGKVLVRRKRRRQGRGGVKRQLCRVAEGKHFLQPSAALSAFQGDSAEAWGPIPPGICPFQDMDGPFTSPQTAVLEQLVPCSCRNSVCGEGQVIVEGVWVPAWQCQVPSQARFAAAVLLCLDPK